MVSGAGVTYTYDAAGRRVQETGSPQPVQYTWDARDRLKSFHDTGGTTTSYTYDTRGVRQVKEGAAGTDLFLVDRDSATGISQIVRESSASVDRSFVYGSRLLQTVNGGATSYRHFNQVGSTRLLTDATGMATDTFDYQAYGGLLSHVGSSAAPHSFAGEESDPESGLTYLRARYYDPRTRAFLSRDPQLGDPSNPLSLNPYLYALGNPVNRIDPSGRESLPAVLISYSQRLVAAGQRVLNARKVLVKAKDLPPALCGLWEVSSPSKRSWKKPTTRKGLRVGSVWEGSVPFCATST